MGHSTDRCWALKHKIQDLLNKDVLQQEETSQNPFTYHARPGMSPNLVEQLRDEMTLTKLSEGADIS